jgi:drug/metabolite transporter (DMT)-like permease
MGRLESTLRGGATAGGPRPGPVVPSGRGPPTAGARTRARLQLLGAALFFGLMAVSARYASRGSGGFSAGQLAVVRFVVGIAGAVVLFRLRPGTFAARRPGLLVARGLLGGTAVVLYFLALARIPAGQATLLNNLSPVFATLMSLVVLRERATGHLALALAVTTAGVLLVLGGGSADLGFGWGEIAGLASAVLAAAAMVVIRVLRADHDATTVFFAFSVCGLLVSVPFAGGAWTAEPLPWAAALATGGLSIVAQMLMTHSFGALTVPEAAVWQQLTPAASYLWALGLLGERFSLFAGLGVVLVVVGVVWGVAFGTAPGRGEAA